MELYLLEFFKKTEILNAIRMKNKIYDDENETNLMIHGAIL
jgi:hypothetical protein